MNEHRNVEIIVVKHGGDVGQMHPNLVPCRIVLIGFDIDFDDPAVWKKREMMNRVLVGESHCIIATIVDACRVIIRLLMLIVHGAFHGRLGPRSCGQA